MLTLAAGCAFYFPWRFAELIISFWKGITVASGLFKLCLSCVCNSVEWKKLYLNESVQIKEGTFGKGERHDRYSPHLVECLSSVVHNMNESSN